MKLLFLGTGAADWTAEWKDNPQYRRYSSVLVDDVLLIDPNPCVLEAAQTFDVDISKIKYVVNTHRHKDHFDPEVLRFITDMGASFVEFSGNEIKQLGKYTVEALAGNHGGYPVQHYLIDDGEKRLFYGLDSAWLLKTEVERIQAKFVDMAVFDATIGDRPGDYRIFEHCNLNMIEEMQRTLKPYIGRFVISHMARTLHTDHETLVARVAKNGIEVAHDGLIMDI